MLNAMITTSIVAYSNRFVHDSVSMVRYSNNLIKGYIYPPGGWNKVPPPWVGICTKSSYKKTHFPEGSVLTQVIFSRRVSPLSVLQGFDHRVALIWDDLCVYVVR